jgi:1-phosphofructokinase
MHEVLTVACNPAIDQAVEVAELRQGEVNRALEARMDPGGKGINVARVLGGWGVPVLAAGWLGSVNGAFITRALDRLGVAHRFVPLEGVTRVNLKITERGTGRVTEVNAPGFRVAREDANSFLRLVETLLDQVKVVVLSGSLPPGAPPDLYQRCVEIARAKGIPAFLDAEGEPLSLGLEAVPFAVKPNRRELERFAGRPLRTDAELLEAGRALLEKGIHWVVISDGARGAWMLTPNRVIRTVPPKIAAKSPVGAGDSMVAALAWGRLKGWTEEETARWATAAGTVTASLPGTELCGLEETKAMCSRIHVESAS